MSVLPPAEEKATYVHEMFGAVAGHYDRMNRLMTFGQDRRWRRLLVHAAALPPGGRLLDVGTGTGDIALEARCQVPGVRVVAADFTLPMMLAGRAKAGARDLAWLEADTFRLPFADHTFDAVASGFLLRNVADVVDALGEQRRVIRPGGHVVCLETSPPPDTPLRSLINLHLTRVIPLLGRLFSSAGEAYTYLPQSSIAFMEPEALAGAFRQAGLRHVRYRRLMMGTVAIHIGVK